MCQKVAGIFSSILQTIFFLPLLFAWVFCENSRIKYLFVLLTFLTGFYKAFNGIVRRVTMPTDGVEIACTNTTCAYKTKIHLIKCNPPTQMCLSNSNRVICLYQGCLILLKSKCSWLFFHMFFHTIIYAKMLKMKPPKDVSTQKKICLIHRITWTSQKVIQVWKTWFLFWSVKDCQSFFSFVELKHLFLCVRISLKCPTVK